MNRANMRRFFSIVKQELGRKNWNQKRLAKETGYSPSTVSQYLGKSNVPEHFLEDVAKALNSRRLRLILKGTTSEGVYMDNVFICFPLNVDRLETECQELLKMISKVKELNQFQNVFSIARYKQSEKRLLKEMLKEMDDLKHCIDIVNIAADDIGLNPDEIRAENLSKYFDRGYISSEIQKDTYSPQVSVLKANAL